ncbi:hypothetical protein Btru_071237 [Bulinus truncatus]|nr:hypothetical protein Btru_071237 [Bulinus truncatus]
MAAPTSLHEFGVPEPTYCRLNQINLKAKDQLKPIVSLLSYLIPSQVQHNTILSEFKILNLVLYKRGGQLRKAKCFQLLKRVQACLKRLGKFEKLYQLMINLNNDLKRHLSQQFAIGWLIPTMIVFMGIVARIWLLCGTLIEKVVTSYNKLHPYKDLFEPSVSTWSQTTLPTTLCPSKTASLNLTEKFVVVGHEVSKPEFSKMNQMTIEEDLGVPVQLKRKLEDLFQPNKRPKVEDDNNNGHVTEMVIGRAEVAKEKSFQISESDFIFKKDKLKKNRKKKKLTKDSIPMTLTEDLGTLPLKKKKKLPQTKDPDGEFKQVKTFEKNHLAQVNTVKSDIGEVKKKRNKKKKLKTEIPSKKKKKSTNEDLKEGNE